MLCLGNSKNVTVIVSLHCESTMMVIELETSLFAELGHPFTLQAVSIVEKLSYRASLSVDFKVYLAKDLLWMTLLLILSSL